MDKLCECGVCGLEVTNPSARFIHGHHRRGVKVQLSTILKRKETNLTNCGYDNAAKSPTNKEKMKNSWKNKTPQEMIIKEEKSRSNYKKKTGFDDWMRNPKVIEQRKSDYKEKTGFDHPLQDPFVLEKFNRTMVERYGVDWAQQSQKIQEKSIKTNQEHRNTDYTFQSSDVQKKSRETLLNNFGFDNYSKTDEFKHFIKQYRSNHHNIGWSPLKGKYEKMIFDELQLNCSYLFLEDQQFLNYHPDRYIKELNIIIELYEPWHKQMKHKIYDNKRQIELEEKIHCKFFIIKLKEWMKNKELIIEDFKIFLGEINASTV